MSKAIKERPILFSGAMVRAILEGRKVKTRRIVKPQPEFSMPLFNLPNSTTWGYHSGIDWGDPEEPTWSCPYGQAGDRLWVRETWRPALTENEHECFAYRATMSYRCNKPMPGDWESMTAINGGWKPSIHMPRKASRIILEVTNIRVERLQDISEEDAIAEGVEREGDQWKCYSKCPDHERGYFKRTSATASFMSLWDSINAKRGYSWDSNPWVWVVEFKQLTFSPYLKAGDSFTVRL